MATILIIDDEEIVRVLLRSALRAASLHPRPGQSSVQPELKSWYLHTCGTTRRNSSSRRISERSGVMKTDGVAWDVMWSAAMRHRETETGHATHL